MASPPLFQRATVTRIVRENPDVHTFVLAPHDGPFTYRAGQFCIFRVRVNGRDLMRSYSMSSAPETDAELMTTVKRVPGGAVSNWLLDNIDKGDEVELTAPRGAFLLRPAEAPLLGFSGGSGITPILSLAKSALATTDRPVRLLCADRDQGSTIFETALAELTERYRGRLVVVRHLDTERGFLDAAAVREFVGTDPHADSYICGPEPFMALVESALTGPGAVFTERFGAKPPAPTNTAPSAPSNSALSTLSDSAPGTPSNSAPGTLADAAPGNLADAAPGNLAGAAPGNLAGAAPGNLAGAATGTLRGAATGTAASPASGPAASSASGAAAKAEPDGTVTIRLGNKRVSVPRRPNETLLESARRGGLAPPFSCEAGNCASCLARLTAGTATMRVNDALTEEEVADGYVLTCQAVPDSASVTVRYE